MTTGFGKMQERDLMAEYRRRIDVESVIDHYGIDVAFRIGDELQMSCPIDRVDPHHAHGDANPSTRMNISKKAFICYSYGGGDIFWFIARMEGKETFAEILPMLGQFLGESVVETKDFLAEVEELMQADLPEIPAPVYSDRILRRWKGVHPYLYKDRGVTVDAATRLRIGYDQDERRIVFPHFVDGKLVGWQKRSLQDPRWPQSLPGPGGVIPKYQSSPGMPKGSTLYNLDRVRERECKHIVVVESPMSVAKAESLWSGAPDDLLGAVVATFGSKVTDRQVELLRAFQRVYVYQDDDQAGQESSAHLIDRLYRHTDVRYVQAEPGKDLGDYDEPEAPLALIANAEPAVLFLARQPTKRKSRYG